MSLYMSSRTNPHDPLPLMVAETKPVDDELEDILQALLATNDKSPATAAVIRIIRTLVNDMRHG